MMAPPLPPRMRLPSCARGSTASTRPTSPWCSKRCRSRSASSSGISSRPIATARSCSKSPTRCARRSSQAWTSASSSRRPSSSTPTRSPTSRRTCRAEVIQDVIQVAAVEEREQLRAAMSYDEDAVGALMDFDMVEMREDVTLEVVLRICARSTSCPITPISSSSSTASERLQGCCRSTGCCVTRTRARGRRRDGPEFVQFNPAKTPRTRRRRSSATTWSPRRWSTTTAGWSGSVTVNAVVDYIRERAPERCSGRGRVARGRGSLRVGVEQRQEPLGVARGEPGTAFIASRVIGVFERSIDKARRARRADADHRGHRRQLRQPDDHHDRACARARPDPGDRLAQAARQGDRRGARERRDLGTLSARWPTLIYGNVALGGVMALAMVLNLLLAAADGRAIPYLGRARPRSGASARRC